MITHTHSLSLLSGPVDYYPSPCVLDLYLGFNDTPASCITTLCNTPRYRM